MNLVPSQVRQQLVKEQVDRRVISKLLVNTLANITPQREKEGNQAAVKVQSLAAPRKCCLGEMEAAACAALASAAATASEASGVAACPLQAGCKQQGQERESWGLGVSRRVCSLLCI